MHEISCKLSGDQSTIEKGAEDQVNEKASLESPNTLNKNESVCCQKDKESLQTIERGAEDQVNEKASLESPNTLNTNEGTCCQKDKESLQSH
jgi:hypothetical protein